MAQLNPNFEIDFSDINSYEQIQLINDAQLARENLLMHRAYREPSDDEVIRQNYSSYTFIDFRPRIFAAKSVQNSRNSSSRGLLMAGSTSNESDLTFSTNRDKSDNAATSETFNGTSNTTTTTNTTSNKPCYELEKFSSIFERINIWLKLNKEWQAVSVETLFYDSSSQFNHIRSSTYSNHLPKNTRGIRLHLSPFKSRFSGPQKIGCINVVPRRLNGHNKQQQPINQQEGGSANTNSDDISSRQELASDDSPANYENLDQILARLNELLLSRPIEGRILSVETITFPIINGRVDFECNYITDSRLNLLEQFTNCSADPQPPAGYRGDMRGHCLVDILRVYYEFGPMVCGLVNLIDYVPRFYSPTEVRDGDDVDQDASSSSNEDEDVAEADEISNEYNASVDVQKSSDDRSQTTNENNERENSDLELFNGIGKLVNRKSFATESLTRLIRRSLAWFEDESRRVFEASPAAPNAVLESTGANGMPLDYPDRRLSKMEFAGSGEEGALDSDNHLKLRLCNIQVHHKTFLKGELYKISPSNILDVFQTRTMIHRSKAPLISSYSKLNQLRKSSLGTELSQPYDVKFVRLAYVLPIYDRLSHTVFPLCAQLSTRTKIRINSTNNNGKQRATVQSAISNSNSLETSEDDDDEDEEEEDDEEENEDDQEQDVFGRDSSIWHTNSKTEIGDKQQVTQQSGHDSPSILKRREQQQRQTEVDTSENGDAISSIKRWALQIMNETNERHLRDELAHQAGQGETDKLNESPIGQLTYRLFAPCQLVNSNSCFAINPINSSSPLARRGSVDLNGSGLSSDSAHPSTLFPSGASPTNDSPSDPQDHQDQLQKHTESAQLLPHSLVNEIINEDMPMQTNNKSIPIIAAASSSAALATSSSSCSNSNSLPKEMSSSLKSFGALFPSVFNADSNNSGDSMQQQASSFVNAARLQAPIQALGTAANSIISAGAGGADNQHHHQSRFTTNEFESVEAIRKRMEIYVTTNSMKVLAGETLIVNLSSNLSCLSNAIEQTVVRSSFARTRPSTWVSVYMIYAAVDEPLIPSQLLAQQKLRELTLISEEESPQETKQRQDLATTSSSKNNKSPNSTAEELMTITIKDFDDRDQKGDHNIVNNNMTRSESIPVSNLNSTCDKSNKEALTISEQQHDSNINMNQYNCAYERIVALPTNPEDHMNHIDPGDYLEEQLESELLVAQQLHNIAAALDDATGSSIGGCTTDSRRASSRTTSSTKSSLPSVKRVKKSRKNKRLDDTQCSII